VRRRVRSKKGSDPFLSVFGVLLMNFGV
jgi:hypothetical protein